jgi:GGDEF domain-containing protein
VLHTLREQEEVLRRAALYDDLTGLPNRSHFRDRLMLAMDRARSRLVSGYAVLLLDLDRFKVVNDSLGREAGDRLLQEVSRRVMAELRANEAAARLGGRVRRTHRGFCRAGRHGRSGRTAAGGPVRAPATWAIPRSP